MYICIYVYMYICIYVDLLLVALILNVEFFEVEFFGCCWIVKFLSKVGVLGRLWASKLGS